MHVAWVAHSQEAVSAALGLVQGPGCQYKYCHQHPRDSRHPRRQFRLLRVCSVRSSIALIFAFPAAVHHHGPLCLSAGPQPCERRVYSIIETR